MHGCRWCLMWCALAVASMAHAAPAPLRLCASNQGDYPWVLVDRPGLNQLLIERASARSGTPVQFHYMRWGHCLLRLSDGRMDGAFNSSFIPERQAFARFPMRDGKPDGERRLMHSGYHLFQRKSGTAQWDGNTLKVSGPVGVPSGSFAITRRLREVGLTQVDQSRYGPADILLALRDKELDAAVLKSEEGMHLLRKSAELGAVLEMLPLPIAQKDFFLVYSLPFMAVRSAEGERLWEAIARERESPAWQRLQNEFLGSAAPRP
ncbi:MAG: hypothetical protein Q7T32_04740 [Moraxellaceae bacterium]|nr:hypothetical protein [Moraxellaceae bacterium]